MKIQDVIFAVKPNKHYIMKKIVLLIGLFAFISSGIFASVSAVTTSSDNQIVFVKHDDPPKKVEKTDGDKKACCPKKDATTKDATTKDGEKAKDCTQKKSCCATKKAGACGEKKTEGDKK